MVPGWFVWRRLLGGIALLLVLLVGIVAVRTGWVETRQAETEPTRLRAPADAPQHLARALQIQTLTNRDPTQLDSS
ncbi:MAG: peptidase M20, partial [Bacteroidetes bacterium QH_2_63_10]